jgi:hypothetical protein
MGIDHPVAVYTAENNVEAQQLCEYFGQYDVEAYPTLDDSLAGFWTFGILPGIHKPQVWVDQSNVEAARPLLIEYERELRRRRPTSDASQTASAGSIDVVCEECGKTSSFPASTKGTVQDCSHCSAYVDVGDDESFDWSDS